MNIPVCLMILFLVFDSGVHFATDDYARMWSALFLAGILILAVVADISVNYRRIKNKS